MSRLEQPHDGTGRTWYFRRDDDLPGDQKCMLVIERPDGTYHCARRRGMARRAEALVPTRYFLLRHMLG